MPLACLPDFTFFTSLFALKLCCPYQIGIGKTLGCNVFGSSVNFLQGTPLTAGLKSSLFRKHCWAMMCDITCHRGITRDFSLIL